VTILVTGGAGQLASALAQVGGARAHVVGRPDFDFDRPDTIAAVFQATGPTLVVNAAAWTAVDAAQNESDAAMRANRDGPAELARLCAQAGIPLIHVSTDYVFDGEKGTPYLETDPTDPIGVYGATKLAGETAVLAACPRAIVLRTSWVYSVTGKNFVKTMLRLAEMKDRIGVVADQRGCPTDAHDLAVAIMAVADRLAAGWRDDYAGVFHAAGQGETTWHGLATAVFETAAALGHKVPVVDALTTAQFPTPTKRPADSRLDCTKLEQVFGVCQPAWRDSVGRTVTTLLNGTASQGRAHASAMG
jgi:dTDP-4-dehydrorhamnose reductase